MLFAWKLYKRPPTESAHELQLDREKNHTHSKQNSGELQCKVNGTTEDTSNHKTITGSNSVSTKIDEHTSNRAASKIVNGISNNVYSITTRL